MSAKASANLTFAKDIDPLLCSGFRITSAVLYHPGLKFIKHNTNLSGNSQPSPLYMFTYHQRRMLAAVNDLPGDRSAMINSIAGVSGLEAMRSKALQSLPASPAKLRFTLDLEGHLHCESIDLGDAAIPLDSSEYFPPALLDPSQIRQESIKWLVSVGDQSIGCDFTTRHKTNSRQHYDLAMNTAPKAHDGLRSEVLVYNEEKQIMEGCSTTPYFWRDGHWLTPHADCGGNLGTTRGWSLDKGLAVEGTILRHEIQLGEIIILSNGVRGFGVGRIIKV